jgi:uncharacterized protein (TIGR02996 family)
MTRHDELLAAITTDPEDDAARLAFAEHIQASEPDRSQFIEDQVELARERRQRRGWAIQEAHPLQAQYEHEWAGAIAMYATRWSFDRGFITSICIDPYLFLEHGAWLFANAPIRLVELTPPMEGPFPMARLAESPLLSRLDGLSLHDETIGQHDLEQLAASPHLDRLLILASVHLEIDSAIYETLARNPQIRKALGVRLSHETFPGQSYEATGARDANDRAIHAWTDLTPEGKALEARHGYLPWLHAESICERLDAAWLVAQGILPVKPPGSPVGLGQERRGGPPGG